MNAGINEENNPGGGRRLFYFNPIRHSNTVICVCVKLHTGSVNRVLSHLFSAFISSHGPYPIGFLLQLFLLPFPCHILFFYCYDICPLFFFRFSSRLNSLFSLTGIRGLLLQRKAIHLPLQRIMPSIKVKMCLVGKKSINVPGCFSAPYKCQSFTGEPRSK